MVGERIGDYRILSQLGSGTTGTTYTAVHDSRNRQVVIKILHPEVASIPGVTARLQKVAAACSGSPHGGLIPPVEVVFGGGNTGVVMDRVEGKSVGSVIEELGAPLQPEQALPLFTDLLNGVIHAHSLSVVCGNIRPANLLICATEKGSEVRLTDVGIYPMGDRGTLAQHSEATTLEFLRFAAPEVISGSGPPTDESDIYALGATLYQMVTGWPPRIASDLGRLRESAQKPVKRPASLCPDLPRPLELVLLTATAVEPGVRYRSARAFMLAIQRLSSDGGTAAALPVAEAPEVVARIPETHEPGDPVGKKPRLAERAARVSRDDVTERVEVLPRSSESEGLGFWAKIGITVAVAGLTALAVLWVGRSMMEKKPAADSETREATGSPQAKTVADASSVPMRGPVSDGAITRAGPDAVARNKPADGGRKTAPHAGAGRPASGRKRCRVKIVSVRAKGSPAVQSALRGSLRRKVAAFARCCRKSYVGGAETGGRVHLQFVVAASGSVANALVIRSSLADRHATNCVLGVLKRMNVPRVQQVIVGSLTLSFVP